MSAGSTAFQPVAEPSSLLPRQSPRALPESAEFGPRKVVALDMNEN